MLRALRIGYPSLYARNEYVHRLDRSRFEGLVMEVTGLEKRSPTLRAIVGTFEALKAFAADESSGAPLAGEETESAAGQMPRRREAAALNLNYAIYLNLPSTSDVAVFNAIFRSLREHLLE